MAESIVAFAVAGSMIVVAAVSATIAATFVGVIRGCCWANVLSFACYSPTLCELLTGSCLSASSREKFIPKLEFHAL